MNVYIRERYEHWSDEIHRIEMDICGVLIDVRKTTAERQAGADRRLST